jgi:ribose/xylose/arabinose/galactoside ABC-type transport system permease subunit
VSESTTALSRSSALVKSIISGAGPALVLLAMAVALWIMSPAFRSPTSLMLIGLEAAALGLVAAGQTFVILTGGIDLSVEAMVSFAGVIAAILIAGTNVSGGQIAGGFPSWIAIPVALALGMAIGAGQGVLVTAFRMNPLIVTLGIRSVLLGFALVLSRGSGIYIKKDDLLGFLTGRIEILGVNVPIPLILTLILYVICWIVLKQTKFGRYVYAIGGNETSARLSGVRTDLVKLSVYAISGLLAALAGIIVMGRLESGAYQNGTNLTLMSVAAVVIGGTALTGGIGGIWGTLIGVFMIRLVDAGLVYMSFPSQAKEIMIGAIIVVAVLIDTWRRGQIPWLTLRLRGGAPGD